MAAPMVLATAHLLEIFPKPQDHTSASPTTPPWSLHENGLVWNNRRAMLPTVEKAHPQKSYRNVSNAYKHWYQFSDVYLACDFFVQIKSLKKLPSCWRHDPLPARAPLQIGSSWHLGHFQRSRFNAASRQGNDEWRHNTRIPTKDILLSKEKLQGWNEVTRHGCLCMISGFIECFYHRDVPTSRQKIRIPWKFHLNPSPRYIDTFPPSCP